MNQIYLDNAATTKCSGKAAQTAAAAMLDYWGNPSSGHGMGTQAEKYLRQSKITIARALNCDDSEIFFTSGGSEANNLAMLGHCRSHRHKGKIVTTAVEHPSVLDAVKALGEEGFCIQIIAPDKRGVVSADDILAAIDENTILCSVMLVNNETGAVLPVSEIAAGIARRGLKCKLHCDAVQAFGKMPVSVQSIGCDFLSVSGHKIHGPKGVGALYIKKGSRIKPLRYGGGQQMSLHPGTEPMPGIMAMAAAISEIDVKRTQEHLIRLNNLARQRLLSIAGININSGEQAHPSILSISTGCVRSDTMVNALSEKGVYVSSGSACSKGRRSHVLTAMNLPVNIIDSTIRISFSTNNTEHDIEMLALGIEDGIKSLAHFCNAQVTMHNNLKI